MKFAIIFEPNDPDEPARYYTYSQLYAEVSKMANVLREQGVQKGDRVCITCPWFLNWLSVCCLCARIGAIHSVVFAGFFFNALATRINDCTCKLIITADGGYRGTRPSI